jgi:hypothetical protein
MTATLGAALIALCLLTFGPMRRLLRAPSRGAWLANPVNAEYVMLVHLSVLTIGICLLTDALLD